MKVYPYSQSTPGLAACRASEVPSASEAYMLKGRGRGKEFLNRSHWNVTLHLVRKLLNWGFQTTQGETRISSECRRMPRMAYESNNQLKTNKYS